MSEYGVVTQASAIRFERLLPGPIKRVWAYLTDPDKRATWLASGPVELRVGGRMELRFRHADLSPEAEEVPAEYARYEGGVGFEARVTRCEPPRLLSHTWAGAAGGEDSEVTFELSPQGGGVLLVLTHRRLAGRAATVSVSGGWHAHLGILADRLSGAAPRPFWATYARLEAEYEARLASPDAVVAP
jgi:uncharacterized protein YndB with AHSA1/START domain